jgi:DNA polymerase-3 subunit alpha
MAALLTSVITNTKKITEYINTARGMGIEILPPDINEGEGSSSVSEGRIRYGMAAIKSLGRSVIDEMVAERERNGRYKDLKDFMSRLSSKEINKRTLESLIKAGALDSLGNTRKQLMLVYARVLDEVNREKKENAVGQLSMFDFFTEEEKKQYQVQYPDVGEYDRATKLAFEKEVMGIYVSGHPLEEYMDSMARQVTAKSTDFEPDEDTGRSTARDGQYYTVGGLVLDITVKLTKHSQNMAFVTLEDMYGTLEIILFPKVYQEYRSILNPDSPIYVRGRASVSEESGKLIADRIVAMDAVEKEIWIRVDNLDSFHRLQEDLFKVIRAHPGKNELIVYLKDTRQYKRLPSYQSVSGDSDCIAGLKQCFGEKNIAFKEKTIAKSRK